MKLYKFRSFENIDFTLDIILNNQLFCSPHQDLNNPFEGLFAAIEWKGGIVRDIVRPIVRPVVRNVVRGSETTVFKSISDLLTAEKEIRVCSLSSSYSDVRMWSHYAASHTGMAIEIELDETIEDRLYEVEYHPGIKKFTTGPSAEPSRILSFKTDHWAHEQEYRIITEESFYPIEGKITGIYFGIRSKALHREMIQKITGDEIPLYETKINEETVEVIASNQLT